MPGKAIIFSAPSGAGKTTIVRHLLTALPMLSFSVSATTRAPRPNELHGRDYYFLSLSDFKRHIDQDDLLEWQEVYNGSFYGTLKSEIQRLWDVGYDVVFDVDVVGGINLKNILKEKALSIFVQAPDVATLRSRLKARGTESAESLEKRVGKALDEMKFAEKFDKILVNDDLSLAKDEAERLVKEFISN